MRFAKQVNGSTVRFCRVKRKGTKNCRVIWLDNQAEELLPLTAVQECSHDEASGTQCQTQADTAAVDPALPTRISGDDLCRLMKNYQVSVKELAGRLQIPTDHVREARSLGLDDPQAIAAWTAAIGTQPEAVLA